MVLQLRPVESSAVPSRQHQTPIVRRRGRSPDRTMAQEPSTTVREVRLDCAMEHHATKRRSHGTKSSPAGRRNANFVDTSTDSTAPRRSKLKTPNSDSSREREGPISRDHVHAINSPRDQITAKYWSSARLTSAGARRLSRPLEEVPCARHGAACGHARPES